MAKKKKTREWIVRMRVTNVQDFIVEAANEEDARHKANHWESVPDVIVETPDWEIVNVTENI